MAASQPRSSAILARDVAYCLLNAPSVDCAATPSERRRKKHKFYHYAMRCIDPFILYDTLYWDPSVPSPANDTRDVYFSEAQIKFYQRLLKTEAIRPLPITKERFENLYADAVEQTEEAAKNGALPRFWAEMKRAVPDLDQRYWLTNPCALDEESIFWQDSIRLQQRSGFQVRRRPGGTIEPWVFSALLCAKLQFELSLPGVYSTFSFPTCSMLMEERSGVIGQSLIRQTLRAFVEYYKKVQPFQITVTVPSFSVWCVGTGQTSKDYSNLAILERALEIRENQNIGAFRREFWLLLTKLLGDSTEEGKVPREVETALSSSISGLIEATLPSSLLDKAKKGVLSVLIGAPFVFLDPTFGISTAIGMEFLRRAHAALAERRRQADLGWLFLLHQEISGYS